MFIRENVIAWIIGRDNVLFIFMCCTLAPNGGGDCCFKLHTIASDPSCKYLYENTPKLF